MVNIDNFRRKLFIKNNSFLVISEKVTIWTLHPIYRARKSRTTLQNKVRLKALPEQ